MVSYLVNGLNLLQLWVIVCWYGNGTYHCRSSKVPNAKQPPTSVAELHGKAPDEGFVQIMP